MLLLILIRIIFIIIIDPIIGTIDDNTMIIMTITNTIIGRIYDCAIDNIDYNKE